MLLCVGCAGPDLLLNETAVNDQGRPDPRKSLDELTDALVKGWLLAGRDDRDAQLSSCQSLGATASPESASNHSRNLQQGSRVLLDQILEVFLREHEEFAVANANDRRRSWFI
jgi:hypothetical protein